jgi:hypothetical protein
MNTWKRSTAQTYGAVLGFLCGYNNTTHETSYLLPCVLQQTWIPTVSKYDQHDNVNAT